MSYSNPMHHAPGARRSAPKFTRNDLPLLGVSWRHFATEKQAMQFARWAEAETLRDEYPCEAFVSYEPENPPGEQWEVKVRNW